MFCIQFYNIFLIAKNIFYFLSFLTNLVLLKKIYWFNYFMIINLDFSYISIIWYIKTNMMHIEKFEYWI